MLDGYPTQKRGDDVRLYVCFPTREELALLQANKLSCISSELSDFDSDHTNGLSYLSGDYEAKRALFPPCNDLTCFLLEKRFKNWPHPEKPYQYLDQLFAGEVLPIEIIRDLQVLCCQLAKDINLFLMIHKTTPLLFRLNVK